MPPKVVYRLVALLTVAGIIWVPQQLPAQVVQGQVVDSATGAPVARGFVVLLDSLGNEVARALSSGAARYIIQAPEAGRFQLRSERIGFRASSSDFFSLSDGETLDLVLRVAALPVRLSTVVVRGRDRCHAAQGEGTVLVWEEIRKALAAAVWADEQELFFYRTYKYSRELNERRSRRIAEIGTARAGVADAPFRSVSAAQLAREGYIVERGDDAWYYIPDAYTLLDAEFLDTHCFHIVRDRDERPGQVGLAFEPVGGRTLPDVEGTLWLDETSSELRELDVRHTEVRYEVRDRRIGGNVRFLMLPSGAWIVREWQIRMPKITVTEHPRYIRGYDAEVKGFTDSGGEIYRVSTRDGTTLFEAPLATVVGTVFDSSAASYLGGAFVRVDGTDFQAITDSAGRFDLSVPLAGEYTLRLSHPRLDSLAVPEQAESVELERDSTTAAAFALPSVRSNVLRLCGRDTRVPATRVILGVVRDSGTGEPANGAKVSASWQYVDLSRPDVVVRNVRDEVNTDDSGLFAVCDVPAASVVRLWAEQGGKRSREASLLFAQQLGKTVAVGWDRLPGEPYDHEYEARYPVWKVDLSLGAGRMQTLEPSRSVLQGVVTDSASGEPLEGVTVILNDSLRTVTDADGKYQLTDVVWREALNHVEFSRLGYTPGTLDVLINTTDREVVLNVSLPRLAVRMTDVVVEGERISVPARLAGFYQRREVGIGEFLTEADWEDLPEFKVEHVLNRMHGVTVDHWRVLMANAPWNCRRNGISARIWVDGVSVHQEFIQDMNIDDVTAIEVYRRIADIPVQFNSSADQGRATFPSFSSAACGVVLIWTK
jgi:hypothetical protein